jgi:phage host-nuclease inhibitor protein Gam
MTRRETKHEVREMSSAETATGLVRRMVQNETRGWGDLDNALNRLEARTGLPFWTLKNLYTGRAKTVEASLFNRINQAFADHCGAHAARLLHEAQMARVGNTADVDVAAIEDQIRALASKLEAAKSEAARAVR